MARLLVVDDEPNVLYSLEKTLGSDTLELLAARTARQGIDLVREKQPDAVILDVRLPDMSGLEAFDRMRQIDPRLPVIIVTAFAATDVAIEAMKRGAFEYLLKPLDLDQLHSLVDRAVELSRLSRVPAVFDQAATPGTAVDRIVGQSAVMQEVYKAVGRAAPQDVTVLILGESGTGKELVARAIYHHSRRNQSPFLPINCAAIPETLLESELFGHEKGAFTGADRRRIGKFEQANGGTIFLDEIGDMSSATQSKILRLLQEQRFERLGGNETIRTDVRVIAATNQDLENLVAANRFRADLYYRLDVFTIRIPPLRERSDDLPLLVEHFVKTFNHELDKQVQSVSPEAMRLLAQYHWPGNVRELQSTVKYAMLRATGPVLTPDCLVDRLTPTVSTHPSTPSGPLSVAPYVRQLLRGPEPDLYDKVCREVDRVVLTEVLEHCHGNQVQASELLGISRNTLRAKLRSLGLALKKHVRSESEQPDPGLHSG